jgi:hypothetical protein
MVITSEHETVLRDALKLVSPRALATYEQPDPSKVAKIALSLRRTKVLTNPIVIDASRGLLIDGHHRAKAFEWLGLTAIPCYSVDYLSAHVEVRGWSRVTTSSARLVCDAYDAVASGASGPWIVRASTTTAVIAQRSFDSAFSGAWYLDRVSGCLAAMGRDVRLEPSLHIDGGRIHNRLEPVVGKPEVLGAVESGRTFPCEVNRHLIDGRPVAMDFPLECVGSIAAFNDFVDESLAHGSPELIDSGHQHEGRLYEERVTTFSKAR